LLYSFVCIAFASFIAWFLFQPPRIIGQTFSWEHAQRKLQGGTLHVGGNCAEELLVCGLRRVYQLGQVGSAAA
jgi:hypothetical protein